MSLNSECSRLHWNVRRDYARLVVLRSQSTSLWHLGQGPPPIISIQWPNMLALLKTYSFQRLERFLTQEQHIWLDYLDNNSSVVSFPLPAELEVDLALDVHEDKTPSEPWHHIWWEPCVLCWDGFFLRRLFILGFFFLRRFLFWDFFLFEKGFYSEMFFSEKDFSFSVIFFLLRRRFLFWDVFFWEGWLYLLQPQPALSRMATEVLQTEFLPLSWTIFTWN